MDRPALLHTILLLALASMAAILLYTQHMSRTGASSVDATMDYSMCCRLCDITYRPPTTTTLPATYTTVAVTLPPYRDGAHMVSSEPGAVAYVNDTVACPNGLIAVMLPDAPCKLAVYQYCAPTSVPDNARVEWRIEGLKAAMLVNGKLVASGRLAKLLEATASAGCLVLKRNRACITKMLIGCPEGAAHASTFAGYSLVCPER